MDGTGMTHPETAKKILFPERTETTVSKWVRSYFRSRIDRSVSSAVTVERCMHTYFRCYPSSSIQVTINSTDIIMSSEMGTGHLVYQSFGIITIMPFFQNIFHHFFFQIKYIFWFIESRYPLQQSFYLLTIKNNIE